MLGKTEDDPLLAALAAAPTTRGGQPLRVVKLFGDRPEVLAAIQEHHARGVSTQQLAEILTASLPEGVSISDSAVERWIKEQKKAG